MHTYGERKNLKKSFRPGFYRVIQYWHSCLNPNFSFVWFFPRVSKYSKTKLYWFPSPRSLYTIAKSSVCLYLWTMLWWSCHYAKLVTAQTILIVIITWSTLKFLRAINLDFTSSLLRGVFFFLLDFSHRSILEAFLPVYMVSLWLPNAHPGWNKLCCQMLKGLELSRRKFD